jgi:hypothetical protein
MCSHIVLYVQFHNFWHFKCNGVYIRPFSSKWACLVIEVFCELLQEGGCSDVFDSECCGSNDINVEVLSRNQQSISSDDEDDDGDMQLSTWIMLGVV